MKQLYPQVLTIVKIFAIIYDMNKMEFGPKTAEQYVADMYKRIGSFEGGYDPKSDPNLKDVILDRDTLERIIYGQTLDPQVPKTPQGAAPAARIDWGTF